MSIAVDLDALREELAAHERPAYLATAGTEGAPHVVSAYLRWVDGHLEAECGRTTAANLVVRPSVSLVVPPNEVGGYSLIVDARAEVVDRGDGEPRTARLTPTKAVLHRPAEAPGEAGGCGHDCLPVG
ncbi:MAG TPA: pyridoxamine 5'-phosphate oxidase family protein [Acidimicrobiales bacterium]